MTHSNATYGWVLAVSLACVALMALIPAFSTRSDATNGSPTVEAVERSLVEATSPETIGVDVNWSHVAYVKTIA